MSFAMSSVSVLQLEILLNRRRGEVIEGRMNTDTTGQIEKFADNFRVTLLHLFFTESDIFASSSPSPMTESTGKGHASRLDLL